MVDLRDDESIHDLANVDSNNTHLRDTPRRWFVFGQGAGHLVVHPDKTSGRRGSKAAFFFFTQESHASDYFA